MKLASVLFVTLLFCVGFAASDSTTKHSCSVPNCINNGNTDPSTAFLCKNCVAMIMSNSNFEEFRETQHKLLTKRNKKLAGLNPDVLAIIFDELSIQQMINFLEIYPARTLYAAAKYSFYRRYKHLMVVINHGAPCKGIEMCDDNHIKVNSKELSERFLRIFGDVVQRLDMQDPSINISQYVNKYTSDTLKELVLYYDKEDASDIFRKPFKSVEVLTLKVGVRMETGNTTLADIFPKVKSMELQLRYYDDDASFFVGELPHLSTLTLYSKSERYILYAELIRNNPQILNLTMNEVLPNFANEISGHLKNLQFLNCWRVIVENDIIFEQLKELHFREYAGHPLDQLSFPQLEKFKVTHDSNCKLSLAAKYPGKQGYMWIKFDRRHPNVTYEFE